MSAVDASIDIHLLRLEPSLMEQLSLPSAEGRCRWLPIASLSVMCELIVAGQCSLLVMSWACQQHDEMLILEALTRSPQPLDVIVLTLQSVGRLQLQLPDSTQLRLLPATVPAAVLLEQIGQCRAERHARRRQTEQRQIIAGRLAQLTDKEHAALELMMQGHPNKAMAGRLGITERAVEMRRASIMKKLQAHSLAELIRMVTQHALLDHQSLDLRSE